MILILFLLLLGALMKWLQARRRRKQATMMPEGLGVPVGDIWRLKDEEAVVRPTLESPMERIVYHYKRLSEGTGKRGRARKMWETPQEFQTALVEASVIPEKAAAEITKQFEKARYARGDVTEQQAAQFEITVDNTLARLTGNLTPTP